MNAKAHTESTATVLLKIVWGHNCMTLVLMLVIKCMCFNSQQQDNVLNRKFGAYIRMC